MDRLVRWFIIGALLTLFPALAAADDLDALRGQTIRVIVAHRAGNTTDTIARLFAAVAEKFLPETSVRVQNLDGSGGTLALNEIYGAGSSAITVGFVNSGVVYSQVTLDEKLPYDLTKFRWVGALAASQRVLVVRKGVVDRADPRKTGPSGEPLVTLTTTANANNYIDGLLINNLTSIRLKMVTGFKTEQQDAMLLSGDADAGIGTYENYRVSIESGDLVPVLRFGSLGYPDKVMKLPALADVARPSAPKDVVGMSGQLSDMGRYVVAAPGTSDAQLAALRSLFGKVVVDADYLKGFADAKQVSSPSDGATLTKFMDDILGNSSAIAALKNELACGQLISDGKRDSCE
jgi:tripartite-type tricarboxylate transporter receptor subunit TctC